MKNVFFSKEARLYLQELAHILYCKNYFSTEEASFKYVADLVAAIVADLPYIPRRQAPAYFDRYGTDLEYIAIRKNKQTVWYVFFDEYEDDGEVVCLVRYITNNHVVAQLL